MPLFLDISMAKGLPFLKPGDPVKIPCVPGSHEWDYDILEEQLPRNFVARMRDCLCLAAGPEGKVYDWDRIEASPVGFNMDSAKKHGARLVEA